MKKYRICLYLFLTVSLVCFWIGYAAVTNQNESDISTTALENSETMAFPEQEAANQNMIQHSVNLADEYYLVSENGFLMVFTKNRESACLYTYIPLMEMPESEQERLREGIWFPSMSELFQYLESCTS